MQNMNSKLRGLSLALALAGTLGMAATADAAVYRGRWDPAYGPALPNLGWSGLADFEVSSACLNNVSVSGWISNLTGPCANQLSIISADVRLYDLSSSNPAPDVMLSYSSESLFKGGNLPFTLQMWIDVSGAEPTVKAVDGGFWFPEKVTADFAKVDKYAGALYWLGFSGFDTNVKDAPVAAEARLASCSYKWSALECSANANKLPGSQALMAITPVPEPQGYLLGLASLAVLGVWKRRRQSKAP